MMRKFVKLWSQHGFLRSGISINFIENSLLHRKIDMANAIKIFMFHRKESKLKLNDLSYSNQILKLIQSGPKFEGFDLRTVQIKILRNLIFALVTQ